MALEAIKKVAETEQLSSQRKVEAVQNAKKLVADAEKAGLELIAGVRREAEAKAKEFMAEAEQKAAVGAKGVAADMEKTCSALRQKAEGHLEDAAALIVRRVVNI